MPVSALLLGRRHLALLPRLRHRRRHWRRLLLPADAGNASAVGSCRRRTRRLASLPPVPGAARWWFPDCRRTDPALRMACDQHHFWHCRRHCPARMRRARSHRRQSAIGRHAGHPLKAIFRSRPSSCSTSRGCWRRRRCSCRSCFCPHSPAITARVRSRPRRSYRRLAARAFSAVCFWARSATGLGCAAVQIHRPDDGRQLRDLAVLFVLCLG